MLFRKQVDLTIEEVIKQIIKINEDIHSFWSEPYGWAPTIAADILSISRLDWQVSLSHTLKFWIDDSLVNEENKQGYLILAWTNLGSLVEGTMKLLLCVYYKEYNDDPEARLFYDKQLKTKVVAEPDVVSFELMRIFYRKRIWASDGEEWDAWILGIQQKRNAIHAFKTREIGTTVEFHNNLRIYLRFLHYITSRLPRP